MRTSHLRVYHGPSGDGGGTEVAPSASRKIRLPCGSWTFCPCWPTPSNSRRTWLGDFKDDEMTISMDLYEVILAYQHYRRPSA